MTETLTKLKEAITTFNNDLSRQMTVEALEEGIEPREIMEVTTEVIRKIGDEFGRGELFLPELVGAASAMSEAISVLEKEMEETGKEVDKLGTVVLGTVKGDIHDIGKTMVKTFLIAGNFRVLDLGVNVSPQDFMNAIDKYDPNILGLSALLTTTIAEQRNTIEALREKGIRDKVKVIIGGAATNKDFANEIGADGYESTAPRAAGICRRLLGKE